MVSESNRTAIEAAQPTSIIGGRIPEVHYEVTSGGTRTWR